MSEILGRVFSIEEFSTYDGPGIRMTVFMKGCPLRCMWCHNPEGQRFEKEMVRSPNGCLGCGACLKKGEELRGEPCLVPESVDVCPRRLVRESGIDYTPEKMVEKIEKNVSILNLSGGGVTFSGGEPLSQWRFVLECMKLLRGKTNRALQTCGFAESHIFEEVLSECDYVLYDLKQMDSAVHKKYTGVGNEQIIENYRTLAKSGKEFITRIPLIPTVNDTEKNIKETAKFMSDLGVNKIELLPYNKMAGGKYLMLGRKYEIDFDGDRAPENHIDVFNDFGIEVKVL